MKLKPLQKNHRQLIERLSQSVVDIACWRDLPIDRYIVAWSGKNVHYFVHPYSERRLASLYLNIKHIYETQM